jgi:putative SOS response-associated peptidase YedK
MCGRYVDELTGAVIDSRFRLSRQSGLAELQRTPRYNIGPMSRILAITADESGRQARMLQWWLIPATTDDPKAFAKRYTTFNARSDKVATSAFYRRAFAQRRCIIPVSGFYEWQLDEPGNPKSRKTPFYIHPPATELPCWAFAGIWETWERPDAEPIHSCAIVTCEANRLMARIHNAKPADPRMPVILDDAGIDGWLDPQNQDATMLLDQLHAYAEVRMNAHAVARLAGDSRRLIDPVG